MSVFFCFTLNRFIGGLQGFKAAPKMGEYVWRFVPGAAAPARMVADGFERPNGLALSADHKVMYVTDTGMMSGADEVRGHFLAGVGLWERGGVV